LTRPGHTGLGHGDPALIEPPFLESGQDEGVSFSFHKTPDFLDRFPSPSEVSALIADVLNSFLNIVSYSSAVFASEMPFQNFVNLNRKIH
jgi:hypothetical protein